MRFYRASIVIIFLLSVSFAIISCNPARYVPKGKYLLTSNKIILKDKVDWKRIKKNIENNQSLSSSLLLYARQKPNKKTLGIFKLNLAIYNLTKTKKMRGFSYWATTHIGEAPVVFDSMMMHLSTSLMSDYLNTKGYLNARVTSNFKTHGRKVGVNYVVNAGPLFTIDSFQFVIQKTPVNSTILRTSKTTVIKKGAPLDTEKLDEERKRIQMELQNSGFYRFNKSEIYFDTDTFNREHSAYLKVMTELPDSNGLQQRYFIRNVFINQNYNPIITLDTLPIQNIVFKGLIFNSTKNVMAPRHLYRVIFMEPKNVYSLKRSNFTISRISDLGVYKFISVQYQQVAKDSLDCIIKLTPNPVNHFQTEINAADIEDNLGNSYSISYLNRNLDKAATIFSLTATGGVEIPIAKADSLLFNLTAGAKFSFPRILFPVLHKKVSRYSEQHTIISFNSNALFQSGVYSLFNQNFSLAYDFREPVSDLKRHQPGLSLTFTRPIIKSDSFKAKLNNDFLLKQSFSDLLITGMNYTFSWSNQNIEKVKNYFFLRTGIEISGGLFYLLNDATHTIKFQHNDAGQSLIFQVPYSNFIRWEFDYKYYFLFGNSKSLVTRFFTGIGVPFANLQVMPYIRQFYVGGPNDIRAWRIRSLGPGSSVANNSSSGFFNQTGDLKLQANIEYRFHIFGILKGALFTDAGNIWMLKEDIENQGANFDVTRFYNEIAIGSGLGLRLDFSYFVFRGDLAIPLRNPSLAMADRWLFTQSGFGSWKWITSNMVFNVAIGYPF